MKRKRFVYVIMAAALTIVLGSSLQFRPLDKKRAEERASVFSAVEYARDFWYNRLQTALADLPAADELIRLFNTDMKAAVALGRTLGQSRVHAYLFQGTGLVTEVQKDGLLVSVQKENPSPVIFLCTGSYIAGNALRDASGLVDVSAFADTMKFNRISAEINRIIVQEVIAPFLEHTPEVGMSVTFIGAAEVGEDATEEILFGQRREGSEGVWHLVRVVPIRLEVR